MLQFAVGKYNTKTQQTIGEASNHETCHQKRRENEKLIRNCSRCRYFYLLIEELSDRKRYIGTYTYTKLFIRRLSVHHVHVVLLLLRIIIMPIIGIYNASQSTMQGNICWKQFLIKTSDINHLRLRSPL